jgi:hypothetical protein
MAENNNATTILSNISFICRNMNPDSGNTFQAYLSGNILRETLIKRGMGDT